MKLLLTGGGTAGHVNPALAIAAAMQEKDPHTEVLFAASALPRDKANDLVPRAGYELKHIHIRGLQRPVYTPKNLMLPVVMLKARREARQLIREFQPDLIVGTGGFACWPVVAEGAARGIPTAVHESNAQPGKAILQVKHKVDRIFINFPDTKERLGLNENEQGKVCRVGNPVMPGFGSLSKDEARRALGLAPEDIYILAFGGSLGAENLNDALVAMSERLVKDRPNLYMTFAAGKRDMTRTQERWKAGAAADCPRVRVVEYLYDMPVQMAAADVVVSRAGAMTVSELALSGKAAVLVPSPYVTDDHQLRNAQALVRAGAGLCVEESKLTEGALDTAVLSLLDAPQKRAEMGAHIREAFACPDANEHLCRELLKLVKQGK